MEDAAAQEPWSAALASGSALRGHPGDEVDEVGVEGLGGPVAAPPVFADGSQFPVVRGAWRELFVPNARLLAGGLAVFELGLGVPWSTGSWPNATT